MLNAQNIWSINFPPPSFLSMGAVGLDLSDHSIKFMEFTGHDGRRVVNRFGERPLPEGTIVGGELLNVQAFTDTLIALKSDANLSLVRSALPESRGYLFQTVLKNVRPSEARAAIEFQLEEHIPLSRAEAVFDAEPVWGMEAGESLGFVVTAFPEKVVTPYLEAFSAAGLFLLSLELEAQAIARSIVRWHDKGTFLLVDLGETHTGVSVVSGGVVHYASSIDIAGRTLTASVAKGLSLSEFEARRLKHTQGMVRRPESEEASDAMMTTASALFDEISQRISYWDSHYELHLGKKKIEKIYLCGGNAGIPGLPEYLTGKMHIPVSIGDVWGNVSSSQEMAPPIDPNQSHRFATAIGLALRRGS